MRRLIHRAKKGLFHWSPELAARCGFDFRLKAPNRSFLEQQIFDYLNQQATRTDTPMRCLFVGMHEYTWHYPRLLKMEFHSLDMDPEQAIYGPTGRHTIGSATNMSEFYAEASFDVVVANGVIGWGLNKRADFERLMEQCHRVLKPAGLLILGYNDTPEHAPFEVDIAWRDLFAPTTPAIPGVTQARHAMNDSYAHVFIFGERRPALVTP
ncbi:class I SAM-dependent methyltransferase [Achromobacter xylosoxidans]|uniref:class I SAM-dependent methyltransferase n=1 Tax=Alcaligenes xylosoxydans xylosoxydans TaxID=85698 RepID=UPI00211AFC16|nr:class I SAM-dependent methyltransferase [Achromobacter xylosoxidans]